MSKKFINGKIIKRNYRNLPLWNEKDETNLLIPDILKTNDFNPSKNALKDKKPHITNCFVKIPLTIEKKNTWVFYWVIEDINETNKIMYNENYGLVKTNNDGKCNIEVNCPVNFKNKNLTYPRYICFTYLTKDNIWNENITILTVLNYVKYNKLLKILDNKDKFIVYVTNEKYQEDYINNSYILNYNKFNEMNINEKDEYINKFILDHIKYYPKLDQLLKDNKISIENIPILIYGLNKKTELVKSMINLLSSLNFNNLLYFYGGLEEWNKMQNIKKLEENLNDDDDIIPLEYEGVTYKMYIDSSELVNENGIIIGLYNKKTNKVKWENENYEKLHNDNPSKVTNNIDEDNKYKQKLTVIKGDDLNKDENNKIEETNISESEEEYNFIDDSNSDYDSDTDSYEDTETDSDTDSETDSDTNINAEIDKENNDKEKKEELLKPSSTKLLSELVTQKKKKKTFKKRKNLKTTFF